MIKQYLSSQCRVIGGVQNLIEQYLSCDWWRAESNAAHIYRSGKGLYNLLTWHSPLNTAFAFFVRPSSNFHSDCTSVEAFISYRAYCMFCRCNSAGCFFLQQLCSRCALTKETREQRLQLFTAYKIDDFLRLERHPCFVNQSQSPFYKKRRQ